MKTQTQFLLTPCFLSYLKENFPDSLNFFLKNYNHKTLPEIGLEIENLSEIDEEFLESILNEYLLDVKYELVD
jgi:hypothetical protein